MNVSILKRIMRCCIFNKCIIMYVYLYGTKTTYLPKLMLVIKYFRCFFLIKMSSFDTFLYIQLPTLRNLRSCLTFKTSNSEYLTILMSNFKYLTF